jgi:drug/metabolite transporter (DMT)-like permease
MNPLGLIFITGYIVLVGVGTFLEKLSMRSMSSFQLNFLMSVGMVVIAVPLLLIQQKNLSVASKDLPWGVATGLLFAIGSFLFVLALSKMPAGVTTILSLAYVVVALALSVLFLHEQVSLPKLAGIALVLAGVVVLALQTA